MRKVTLLALVMMFAVVVFASPATAGVKFGVRQQSFHNSILPSDQSLGAYFGVAGGERFEIIFGLDYWNYKFTNDVSLDGESTSETEIKLGTTQLHGGVKMYLREQFKNEVTPYVMAEFVYGIGSASVGETNVSINLDPIKDALSPYGFMAGFGAEFFAADNFSVGGEVGLRYMITKSEGNTGVLDMLDLGNIQLKPSAFAQEDELYEAKFTSMTIYTGISVNFAF
jgi:opacity protein-like surface antigen